ncbi:MAG: type II toxin-antitoxin system RelE/ParE family toxin [Oligoflexia bacterium]|nr:type II toxin-antitoxin system RelE/ParE family toxin [Oligoflexia bacterium]
MKIIWSARSREDLDLIAAFIAKDNPAGAEQWILKIEKKTEQAASHPFAGRIVPEFEEKKIREVLLKSYRIVYQVYSKHIEILTVFEGHRLLVTANDEAAEDSEES